MGTIVPLTGQVLFKCLLWFVCLAVYAIALALVHSHAVKPIKARNQGIINGKKIKSFCLFVNNNHITGDIENK